MLCILIVDDQMAFRRELRRLLTAAGFRDVCEARDIPEAEIMVQRYHPNLALVDILLPGMTGIEGVSRLKSLRPDLRVILISACAGQMALFQAAARNAGAEAFIPKDDLDLDLVRRWDDLAPR